MEIYIFCILIGMYLAAIFLMAGACLFWLYDVIYRTKETFREPIKEDDKIKAEVEYILRLMRILGGTGGDQNGKT